MVWDYPEVNVFSNAVGSFATIKDYISKCIDTLPAENYVSEGIQADAQTDCGLRNIMISTDHPTMTTLGMQI